MAVKNSVAVDLSGPDGNSAWTEYSMIARVASSATLATTDIVMGIVPKPDTVLAGGMPNPQALYTATTPIMRLVRITVATDSAFTADTEVNIWVSVYRAAAQLGSTWAFGWSAVGTGTPAIAGFTATAMPANALNTVAFSSANPTSGVLCQPGDVLVLHIDEPADSVNWPGGQFVASFA